MCSAVSPRESRGNFQPQAHGEVQLLTLLASLGEQNNKLPMHAMPIVYNEPFTFT
jgi:hypothetical protein